MIFTLREGGRIRPENDDDINSNINRLYAHLLGLETSIAAATVCTNANLIKLVFRSDTGRHAQPKF